MTDLAKNPKVMVVNAFTMNGEGGNPAGVVLNADPYTQKQKQKIARLAGFPETAFVSRSDVADRKLEFFTPNKQIPLCGHATVATFVYLNQIGEITNRLSSKETIDGNRKIVLKDGKAFMEQKPQFTKTVDNEEVKAIMASLSLNENDLMPGFSPMISNTGVSFMIIPLNNNQSLQAIQTNLDAIAAISEKHDLIGFYAFTTDAVDAGHDVTTRMFAPRYAIPEESATGMAAGNLGYFLFRHLDFKVEKIVVEQGYFMDERSKSEIIVELHQKEGTLTNIMAGGSAQVCRRLSIFLD